MRSRRPSPSYRSTANMAVFVQDDDRLEAVVVVMGVEQSVVAGRRGRHRRCRQCRGCCRRGTSPETTRNRDRPKHRQGAAACVYPVGFSSREMVDCEHRSRPDGSRSSAILNTGSTRQLVVRTIFVARRDHQQSEADDVSQCVQRAPEPAWIRFSKQILRNSNGLRYASPPDA